MAGGIFGGIGNMLSSFFHPEEGYEEAEKQFRRAWDEARNREQPFVNQGQEQYGNLIGAENSLLDPESMLGRWMQNYQMSPYAKQSLANAQSSGLNAASAQGLLGSNAATQNIQNSSNYIMNQDRSEYLRDLMQKYLAGVGIGKDIYGIGANMAGAMGNQGLEFGRGMGDIAFGEKNAPGNLLGNLLKMGTDIYTGYNNIGNTRLNNRSIAA